MPYRMGLNPHANVLLQNFFDNWKKKIILVGIGFCQLAGIITLVVDKYDFSDYTCDTLWV